MNTLSFTLPEILSLIGVTQCVYLVVHLLFRSRQIANILPLLYFTILGFGFLSDAINAKFIMAAPYLFALQWSAWFLGPPLSVLLIIQMSEQEKLPAIRDFWVLLLVPLSAMLASVALNKTQGCSFLSPCTELKEALNVMGLMAGTISLLVIFSKQELFKNIKKQKLGAERYWLMFSLIILNTLFLAAVFASVMNIINVSQDLTLLRTVLGLGFVYLVSTSLLRMFPPSKSSANSNTNSEEDLSRDEQFLAKKIEKLLNLDKVYQEPTYSRSDLARECDASEMVVSKVINTYFNKSFPQIMNERRVDDAKRLLVETDAAIKTIAEEVGFNSLPSFNRVFKDMAGVSPGEYRKKTKK